MKHLLTSIPTIASETYQQQTLFIRIFILLRFAHFTLHDTYTCYHFSDYRKQIYNLRECYNIKVVIILCYNRYSLNCIIK